MAESLSQSQINSIVRSLSDTSLPFDVPLLEGDDLITVGAEKVGRIPLHGILKSHKIDDVLDKIHLGNMKSVITNLDDEGLLREISDSVIEYFINAGKKWLYIDILCKDGDVNVLDFSDCTLEGQSEVITSKLIQDKLTNKLNASYLGKKRWFMENENEELSSIYYQDKEKLIRDEEPDASFFSDKGRKIKFRFTMNERWLISGFHRAIIPQDQSYRIFLIDPHCIPSGMKPDGVLAEIKRDLRLEIPDLVESKFYKNIHFFCALEGIHSNDINGTVSKEVFNTINGSRMNATSRQIGSDLRHDAFILGGEGSTGKILPYRMRFNWDHKFGNAEASFDGVPAMFDRIDTSLTNLLVQFGNPIKKRSKFLKEVLQYVTY
jgi:hypothetical protein